MTYTCRWQQFLLAHQFTWHYLDTTKEIAQTAYQTLPAMLLVSRLHDRKLLEALDAHSRPTH